MTLVSKRHGRGVGQGRVKDGVSPRGGSQGRGHEGRLKDFLGNSVLGGGLKSLFVVVLLVGCCSLLVWGACRVSFWVYGVATTSDFFSTRHIDITGNVRLTREMVLQFGKIREGDNCLSVSIADVERRLRQTPWVEEASVKRLLPDRFVIRLKERMPSFWVHKDGVLYYANERGAIIAPVESNNFLSLPTLQIEDGADEIIPYLARLTKDLQSGGLPIEAGSVASVTVSPGRGVEIYLEDREIRLAIATDDWSGNLARLGVALGDLALRKELRNAREMRAVNGNVWVLFNKPVEY